MSVIAQAGAKGRQLHKFGGSSLADVKCYLRVAGIMTEYSQPGDMMVVSAAGSTTNQLISWLKKAGAKEVHVRISSPPFLHPCFFGTDVPSNEQLIAHTHTQEEIRQLIGADSLGYMEIEKLKDMVGDLKYCDACFTGKYPMEVPKEDISQAFEQN